MKDEIWKFLDSNWAFQKQMTCIVIEETVDFIFYFIFLIPLIIFLLFSKKKKKKKKKNRIRPNQ